MKNRYNKYNAQKTVVDGITFDSKKEANRYSELKLLEKGRYIWDLELQPMFHCNINGKFICTYKADFRFKDQDAETIIVEDVKGMKTPVYKLKKKLVEALYGITITEV